MRQLKTHKRCYRVVKHGMRSMAHDERGSNVGSSMVGRIVKYSAKFTEFSRYRGIVILLHRSLMMNRCYMIYEARTRKRRTTLVHVAHTYIRTVALTHTYTHSLTEHRFLERTVRAYTRARVESHLKSRDGTAGSLVRQRVTGTLHPRNYRRAL